jgi:glycine/D-amino acid oxidase-like deaminating enzyme
MAFGGYKAYRELTKPSKIEFDKTKKTVVVIGGGIAGLSTTYFLQKNGHQVHLIERSDNLNSGASKANGCWLPSNYCANWLNQPILGAVKAA